MAGFGLSDKGGLGIGKGASPGALRIYQASQALLTTNNINSVFPVFVDFDVVDKAQGFISETSSNLKTFLENGDFFIGFNSYSTKNQANEADLCADVFLNGSETGKFLCQSKAGPQNLPGCTISGSSRKFAIVIGDTLQIGVYRIGGSTTAVQTSGLSTYLTITRVI